MYRAAAPACQCLRRAAEQLSDVPQERLEELEFATAVRLQQGKSARQQDAQGLVLQSELEARRQVYTQNPKP